MSYKITEDQKTFRAMMLEFADTAKALIDSNGEQSSRNQFLIDKPLEIVQELKVRQMYFFEALAYWDYIASDMVSDYSEGEPMKILFDNYISWKSEQRRK